MSQLQPDHKKRFYSCFYLFFLLLIPFNSLQAQLQIQFPISRIVFQRNQSNQSTFPVRGLCSATAERIEVRLTPLQPGQGATIDWQLLDANPSQGQFKGIITAAGGWYQLEVRAIQQDTVTDIGSIDRIGVGEVFLIAGQSNARGLHGLGSVGAADDRISCINYENVQNDTTQLPLPPTFSSMTAETSISPKGQSAWCWGRLGDLLVSRLNVPVLFYNVASAATTVRNWCESARGQSTLYTFGDPLPAGMPYNQFKRVLKDYVSMTGVRAVLWHQGEAEAYDTTNYQPLPAYPTNYTRDLNWLIDNSRQDAGFMLPWMVARVSIDNNVAGLVNANQYQPVIDAQNLTIQTVPSVFAGPLTDTIQFPRTVAGGGVHFSDEGLIALANAWNASLSDAFFSTASPTTPPSMKLVDLQLAVLVDKRVVAVNESLTFSVVVTNTSTNAASQVKITNTLPPNLVFRGSPFFTSSGNTLTAVIPTVAAGQSVVLTYQASPTVAGFYQNGAEINSCAVPDVDSHPGSDVADGEDDCGWADFRTMEPGSKLFQTPIRSGTTRSPAVVSSQPTPDANLADLSLQLIASALTVTVGQPWSFSLLVANQGGSSAKDVQVGCILPSTISFQNSPNMSLSAGVVRGTLGIIPAGEWGMLWFTAIASQPGMTITKAQIESAKPGDPDSTPNNGFTNGEDDTAQSLIRIR